MFEQVGATRALAPTYPCRPCAEIRQHGFRQRGYVYTYIHMCVYIYIYSIFPTTCLGPGAGGGPAQEGPADRGHQAQAEGEGRRGKTYGMMLV